jgi:ATP adenylyltransferase
LANQGAFARNLVKARLVIAEKSTSTALEVKTVLERIWAPWRAQYVKEGALVSSSGTSCFLCDALEGSDDHASLLAWRRPHSMVVLNRFPYNNGHLLVAPRVHKGKMEELTGADLLEPIETIRSLIAILDRMLRPQGYNVGLNLGKAAGAGLPGHLHWHVVPRWDGDTNFMPVLTHTKVIVESLSAFHERLVEEIRAVYGPA